MVGLDTFEKCAAICTKSILVEVLPKKDFKCEVLYRPADTSESYRENTTEPQKLYVDELVNGEPFYAYIRKEKKGDITVMYYFEEDETWATVKDPETFINNTLLAPIYKINKTVS